MQELMWTLAFISQIESLPMETALMNAAVNFASCQNIQVSLPSITFLANTCSVLNEPQS